jgi:hypothetical protein
MEKVKEKIILPDTVQNRIAQALLPIDKCCGSGCRKCNYGRWLKHRNRTWLVLVDEITKRMPPWLWAIFIISSFAAGYFMRGL